MCAALWIPNSVRAQDTLEVTLPEIEIAASRATETEATAPFAVSVLRRPASAIATSPGVTLERLLRTLPGAWLGDRSHFALGERLVVRGMGWRAPFGVRGVQVLLDGVPLTMPDGQAILDVVEPTTLRQAELLRGPASLFWGNASGGVLFLSSMPPETAPALRIRAMGGSLGLEQVVAEGSAAWGKHHLSGYASSIQRDGYREHSAGRFTRSGVRGRFSLGARTTLHATTALAIQDAEHPGSLTADEVAADPQQPNPGFAASDAGKESLHLQTGLTLHHTTTLGLLTATAFGVRRRLDNPLPFATIDLNRWAGGARVQLQQRVGRLGWNVGVDAGWQDDARRNFNTVDGAAGDELRLDQQETVGALAAFGYLKLHLTDRLEASLGLRGDHLRVALDDALLANGDQSGDRTFTAWSPALGLSYRLPSLLLFANLSSAFETPTTTELVNRPDLDGGFNPALDPQRTWGLEVGTRGALPSAHLRLDVALFRLYVRDRLVPFQTDAGGSRTFFRNVGENIHDGVELALTWVPVPAVTATLTYTGSRFVFTDDALDDNRVPGIPPHRLVAEVRRSYGNLFAEIGMERVAAYYVNADNTRQNDGYTLMSLRAGHEGLALGTATLVPFIDVGNLLDTTYNGSIVVNASFGRYYEPAPGRTLRAGLQAAF
jgi:iron complex outermembrane receptor protein